MKLRYILAASASAAAAVATLWAINPDAPTIALYAQTLTALALGYCALLAVAKGLEHTS